MIPLVPPWISAQVPKLLTGHAWLLAGPPGLGQYELALALIRTWLCERPQPQGACNDCASCHGIDVHANADLFVLMPESEQLTLGWHTQDEGATETKKLGKDIKVDDVRAAVEFAQRTNARGMGKAVLVFPAERMNVYAANALLKTLEEPPGHVRFVLATQAAHWLLPTIRSRCLMHHMAWPDHAEAVKWLEAKGVPQAEVVLRAAGGRPHDVQAHIGEIWSRLPRAAQHGDVTLFKDWTPLQTIDVLQKICHDVWVRQCGGATRFFEVSDLPSTHCQWVRLARWTQSLAQARLTVEHPYNVGLMQAALLSEAQRALSSGTNPC